MANDIWHYPRQELAQQVLGMFETGLSSALVFFAPRRMGKTEFLLKDMQPLAKKHRWHVLYFSFLDAITNTKESFTLALVNFATEKGITKWSKLQKHVKKLSAEAAGIQAGIEFFYLKQTKITLKEIITELVKHNNKILLLLDEVQVLSQDEKNKDFIATLRTALDVNKDIIKVIFTGSSQEGLRRMFAKSDAPFFHFGQNLPFPELGRDFIVHLAKVFNKASQREIDTEELWNIFTEMGKVPLLIRSLVERLILYPNLTLQQAKQNLLQEIANDREYVTIWQNNSVLERLILQAIIAGEKELFSKDKRIQLAKLMGIESLPVSTLQSAIRMLKGKNIIVSSPERGIYYIDDPNFGNWIKHNMVEGQH